MPTASPLAGAGLSPDPISDLRQLTEYPFMVNALEAGTIVAVTAGAVESEPHQVDTANPRVRFEMPPLRQVADLAFGRTRRHAEHRSAAVRQRQLAEQYLQQRRLARPVRPEDRCELPLCDRDADLAPHDMPADPSLRPMQAHGLLLSGCAQPLVAVPGTGASGSRERMEGGAHLPVAR